MTRRLEEAAAEMRAKYARKHSEQPPLLQEYRPKQPRKPPPPRALTCACGLRTCQTCRHREWVRRRRAAERALDLPLDQCPVWRRHQREYDAAFPARLNRFVTITWACATEIVFGFGGSGRKGQRIP